jgi:hypothetical protein
MVRRPDANGKGRRWWLAGIEAFDDASRRSWRGRLAAGHHGDRFTKRREIR